MTYMPVKNGFSQNSYPDQQEAYLAGSLAFANDNTLIDAFVVGEVAEQGLEAGLAVIATPAASVLYSGINEELVSKPAGSSTAEDIIGVVVRNQQMGTNAAGHACYFKGDVCNVARTGRSGARVCVQLADGAQPVLNSPVSVIVSGANAGKFATTGGVSMPNMKFKSAPFNGLALVELF